MNAAGVDVGGTKIAAGVVTPEGEILDEVRYPTPASSEQLVETIARAIAEIKEATLGAKSGVLGAAALARDPSSGEHFLGE